MDTLTEDDYYFIASALHPCIPEPVLLKMIHFNDRLHEAIMVTRTYGQAGSPWEFNLRDILRWCELIEGCAIELWAILESNIRVTPSSLESVSGSFG